MNMVKSFAAEHLFREKDDWTEAELQEYKDDVYGFATAAGMSHLQADLEVKKATGAWLSEQGIPLDSTSPRKNKNGKKRKREVVVENPISSKSARGSQQSPHSEDAVSIETRSDDRESVREAQRRKKSEKRARRRARKHAKEDGLSAVSEPKLSSSPVHHSEKNVLALSKSKKPSKPAKSKPQAAQTSRKAEADISVIHPPEKHVPEVQKPKLQSSQSYYIEEEISPLLKDNVGVNVFLSTTDEKLIGDALKKKRREKVEKKKLKKKAKSGPKKSEYFAKPKSSGLPFSTTLKDDIEPSPGATEVDGAEIQRNYGDEMEQLQVATKLLAKATKAGHGVNPDRIKKMAEEAKRAVKNAPVLIKDIPTESVAPSKTKVEPVVENKKKNRNHKRHRNKNRLTEQLSGGDAHQGKATSEDADELGDLPTKKEGQDQCRKSKLDGIADKSQDTHLAIPEKSIMEQESSGNPFGDQSVSQSAPDSRDSNGRPTKRRDRGRKAKSKKEASKMPDAGESFIAEPLTADPDVPLQSIEPIELSGGKKRKHSKSKNEKENVELEAIGDSAAVEPLTELADTNSKNSKKGRHGHTHKRATGVDAMDLDTRPSNQSSKVHHSQ
jgi:hypothetical protein